MAELQKQMNPSRKSAVNFTFFLLSIIVVTAILPHQENSNLLKYSGSFIIVSSSYLVLYLFLYNFRSEVLLVIRKTLFILIIILTFLILTKIAVFSPYQNLLYLIPFAVIPIVIRTFYDARLALFILLITHHACRIYCAGSFRDLFL